MKKHLFLITSAINLGQGPANEQVRAQQTINTLISIRNKAPDSDIFILELSKDKISPETENLLLDHQISQIFYFHDDHYIKSHYKRFYLNTGPHISQIKNFNEAHALLSFFHWAQSQNLQEQYSRFFKISGRYQLNDQFMLSAHESPEFQSKCAFLRKGIVFLNDDFSEKMRPSYMTRLWSFDAKLLFHVSLWFESVNEILHKYSNAGGYLDIEKLLALVIPERYCVYPEIMGVEGSINSSAEIIQE